ncbi:MAG: protein-glutamate O-methyltransferase CheR [Pseudomonadota bacterium]
MIQEFESVLKYLHDARGFDFSQTRYSSLSRKINNRLDALHFQTAQSYIRHLESHPDEWVTLIDLLTINVSRFFRNSLTFETLAKRILPGMIARKQKEDDPLIRIWSAGCAAGEEPYSIAILIHDYLEKEHLDLNLNIFATDINQSVLQKARDGRYEPDQLKNVKLGHLEKYFTLKNDHYRLNKNIKNMVTFSFYDIIHAKTHVPPESVFGSFDMVFCRNLLIYFLPDNQKIIFKKLVRSLAPNGYLILGEAERLPHGYQGEFNTENEDCHIYQKTV